jgi:hypothetical protein
MGGWLECARQGTALYVMQQKLHSCLHPNRRSFSIETASIVQDYCQTFISSITWCNPAA